MPTPFDIQLYTLGMRFKQAMTVTGYRAEASPTLVHAVVSRLMTAIDDLGATTPLSAVAIDSLREMSAACRWLQQMIFESDEDEFLQIGYGEFRRRLQLTVNVAEMAVQSLGVATSRSWYELGFEIVDGGDAVEFDSDEDDEEEDEEDSWDDDEIPSGDASAGLDRTGSQPDQGSDLTINSDSSCTDVDGEGASPEVQSWRWENDHTVRRLLETLGLSEAAVFPAEEVQSSLASWMFELPGYLQSWSRFEAGLQSLRSTSSEALVTSSPVDTVESPFVATPLQQKILAALDGRALRKDELANEVTGGDGSRLYKGGGIKELRQRKLVDHKNGVGFFRPDAPPKGK